MILLSTQTLLAAIQSSISANNDAIRTMSTTNATESNFNNDRNFELYQWGGQFHHVPQGFEFPKVVESLVRWKSN